MSAPQSEKQGRSSDGTGGADFDWQDPFRLDADLAEDERMVRDSARDYCQDKLMPRVISAFRDEQWQRGWTPWSSHRASARKN